MRLTLLATLVLAACAAHRPPPLTVPPPSAGRVSAVAAAWPRVNDVQPIDVALTNGLDVPLRLDARQIYAHGPAEGRVAPLPPPEAARRAGGHHLPGAARGAAVGAATGGILGAVGGVIAGAIQGGIGLAAAAGSAVGAFFGAIAGATRGGGEPDVAGFQDRALHDTALTPGFSVEGLAYFPRGDYRSLEILLVNDHGEVEPVTVELEETKQ